MGGYGGTGGSDGFQNFIQDIGTAVGGSPSTNSVISNMGYLKAPNQANYQIAGTQNYQNQMGQLANQAQQQYAQNQSSPLVNQGTDQQMQAYNQLQNMANGQGPSLAKANLQAGLNQTNQALQSQAMSSAGGAGLGNSQRNLLNAQANASNSVQQQGQQASVAEQMGALQQEGSAANALRNSALAQQGVNLQQQQALQNAQANAYNSAYGANVAQTQANMGYDQANQNYGMAQANVGIQGANSGAQATKSAFGFFGNLLQGSDENMKTDVEDDDDSNVLSFLQSFQKSQNQQNEAAKTPQIQTPSSGTSLSNSGILPMGGFINHNDTRNGLGNAAPQNPIFGNKSADDGLGTLGDPPGSEGGGPEGDIANIMGDQTDEEGEGGESKGLLSGLLGGGGKGGGSGGGGGAGLLGGILDMFSDERVKKDVRPTDKSNQEFMDNLHSKSYRYKNPNTPFTQPGRVHGVMAQDMEKSEVGRGMVHDTPIGKLFNMPKAVSATLSSLATLNKRMDKLESKRSKKAG